MARYIWPLIWLLLIAADYLLGNNSHILVRQDPIFTPAFFVSLAISASISAATYGIQYLVASRRKPIQQGRRSDAVYIQDSQYGIPIPEMYGARLDDELGGFKYAGNIIDGTEIEPHHTTSTVEGGKGPPKPKVEKTTYTQSLDICYGRGPLRFLQIWEVGYSGQKLLYDITASGVTGIIDESWPGPVAVDHFLLEDPETPDPYPEERYGFVPTPDDEGMIEVRLSNGCTARLYPGNDTQLPDPLFESIAGVGQLSAYRGYAHIVYENVDVTQGHPTYLVVAENTAYQTVEEIITARALRTGVITEDDLDLTELSDVGVRGFLISQIQPPRSDAELLGRVYGADFYEGADGKIHGVLLDEEVSETLDVDYVGAVSGDPPEVYATAQVKSRDELDLPFRLDYSAPDPENKFELSPRHATRSLAAGRKTDPTELPVTLLGSELQRLVNRELQLAWREQGSFSFVTTHRYRDIYPSQKIKVPFLGADRTVRVKERRGTVPGLLTFTCTPAEGIILDSIGEAASAGETPAPSVPANTVITLIDLPRLHSPQDVPGIMWAAAPRDRTSGEWSSAALWVNKGSDYQVADVAEGPATMGRVVGSALADVPGGWDEGEWDATSSVTVDLFYGELETLTEAQVLDGDNLFVIGDEVVGVRSWSAVGGHPNRWTGTNMQRRLKGTSSAGHVTEERVVLLNNAVRFVKVDESEADVERTYKATTITPSLSQPLEDARPVPFEWTGRSIAHTEELTILHVTEEITFDDEFSRETTRKNMGAASTLALYL